MIQFSGKDNYVVGIDIGSTTIRGVLTDLEANFIKEIRLPTEINKGFESIMDEVGELVENLIYSSNVQRDRVKGVGIAIAGLVNKNGNVEFSPDFGWSAVDVRKSFYDRLSLPFIYDNSSRLMALGEHEYGKGNKFENFVVINVGYGIAAGIVVNDVPMTGSVGYAGELGHIIVDSKSKVKCRCGAMGCLEALASGRRIAHMGQEAAERKKKGLLFELCNGQISEIDARMVGLAAEMGDNDARAIFKEITSYLSVGIAAIANLLDPQIIFIGGGVSMNGNVFFENLRYSVKRFLISPEKCVSIIPVTFGENASVIGAISLITSKITNFEPLN
jgi:glucokinase-like ROK family protein